MPLKPVQLLNAVAAANSPPVTHATGTIVAVAVASLVDGETFVIGDGQTRQAVGTITTTTVANLVDGETFTITDGTTSKVFEFDLLGDMAITAGNVWVNLAGKSSANDVRDAITEAINAQARAGWGVTASNLVASTVHLRNKTAGVGATAISETVTSTAFVVDGMKNTGSFTFEFDVNGTGWTKTRNRIDVSAIASAAEVRDAIISAVNASGLNVAAFIAGAATVGLRSTLPQEQADEGNVTVTEGVVNGSFAVTGMTGGTKNVGIATRDIGRVDKARIAIRSVGGYGTMTGTFRLWGFDSLAGWCPLGAGVDSTKGTLNLLGAIGETSSDQVKHTEIIEGLSCFERLYLEVVSVGATTSPAYSAWLLPCAA